MIFQKYTVNIKSNYTERKRWIKKLQKQEFLNENRKRLYTNDLDILIEPTSENSKKIYNLKNKEATGRAMDKLDARVLKMAKDKSKKK